MTHGMFADALQAFQGRWFKDSTDYQAALQAGRIALYANRLDEAEEWLNRAIAVRPSEAAPKALLGEALYRRDDFTRAAPILRAANRTLRATKLGSFRDVAPNAIRAPTDVTRLPFVITDPLPVVRGFANGSDTLFFLIDTGGGEVILDSAVARATHALGRWEWQTLRQSLPGHQ